MPNKKKIVPARQRVKAKQANRSSAKTSSTKRTLKQANIKRTAKVRRHAKKLLVPHKGNQYRPHLIRWQGLSALLALILIGQGVYNYAVGGHFAVLGRTTTTTVSGLVADTNQARLAHGLEPLKLDSKLQKAAYEKAQDMFKHDYWAHVSPSGVQPWYWYTNVGYNYDRAGENLAKNYPTSQDTVNAWMGSPTHRANILNKYYTNVGFAVVDGVLNGQQTSLVVAEYAEPTSDAVLASATKPSSPSQVNFSEPLHQPVSFAGKLGSNIQALSPATIGAIALSILALIVALVTYSYRDKLPKDLRKKWAVHHATYKAAALLIVVFMLIASTHGGQI